MQQRLLEIADLPFEQSYTCKNGTIIDIREHLEGLRTPINVLGTTGNIGKVDSLGFAMAMPLNYMVNDAPDDYWDEPDSFVWFVGGWGFDTYMYIANAVRKMRAMFREGQATLSMCLGRCRDTYFEDVVDQVDEFGNFVWGDYPWGGAVEVKMGNLLLHGAVSCFNDDVDDDVIARLILGLLAKQILIGDGLKPEV